MQNVKCYAKKIAAVTNKDPAYRVKSDTNTSESSDATPKRLEVQIVR